MAADFSDFKFYHYDPSMAAAVVFIVLFGITTTFQIWKLFRTKTWYFIPFVLGGLFETVGYIGRAMSAQQESGKWTLGPYIIQTLLLLLAPALFAASIYMILARIILLTDGNAHSIIKLRWVTKVFVAGDVLSFLMQSAGGGLMAKAGSNSDIKMAENIIIGGLGVQVFVFGFFIVIAGVFNIRICKVPTTKSMSVAEPWQKHLYVLYAASALIMVRSVFRIIEYVMGNDGILLQHEYYLYIFDAVLMWIVTVLFCLWHPSEIISGNVSLKKGYRDVESHNSEDFALEERHQQFRAKR